MKMMMMMMITSALMLLAPTLSAQNPAPYNRSDMHLLLRTRIQPFPAGSPWTEARFDGTIVPSRTAIIITDMWDKHWCDGATKRVGLIAKKMEPVIEEARRAGILIIHAPSDTMDFYANTPGRHLAQNAPSFEPPPPLKIKDVPLPIDDSDQGCTTPGDKPYKAWTRENSALTIAPGDVISDSGTEIYNVLREHHIDTILYMGVHVNMCILNRTFGMRQMVKWGMRCILVRDLTDSMYDSASWPFVSHAAGTELVIEYIEQHWGPTVTSANLVAALSGRPQGPSSQAASTH